MTQPSSRRPRGSSRPDRAGAPRGRRPARSGTPTTGPGRRVRSAGTPVSTVPASKPDLASSKVARQIAILGLVLCAVALSLAYPLRNYLEQRADLAAAVADQRNLEQQVAQLQIQQAALSDPDYIRAQAKERLQYVQPGDTVYVVQAPDPGAAAPSDSAEAASITPWYTTLWDTLASNSGPAVDPAALNAPASATTPTP
jgi:cell division protein FtsB